MGLSYIWMGPSKQLEQGLEFMGCTDQFAKLQQFWDFMPLYFSLKSL